MDRKLLRHPVPSRVRLEQRKVDAILIMFLFLKHLLTMMFRSITSCVMSNNTAICQCFEGYRGPYCEHEYRWSRSAGAIVTILMFVVSLVVNLYFIGKLHHTTPSRCCFFFLGGGLGRRLIGFFFFFFFKECWIGKRRQLPKNKTGGHVQKTRA